MIDVDVAVKDCPFCGKQPRLTKAKTGWVAFVYCGGCGARGPLAGDENPAERGAAAVIGWNRGSAHPANQGISTQSVAAGDVIDGDVLVLALGEARTVASVRREGESVAFTTRHGELRMLADETCTILRRPSTAQQIADASPLAEFGDSRPDLDELALRAAAGRLHSDLDALETAEQALETIVNLGVGDGAKRLLDGPSTPHALRQLAATRDTMIRAALAESAEVEWPEGSLEHACPECGALGEEPGLCNDCDDKGIPF